MGNRILNEFNQFIDVSAKQLKDPDYKLEITQLKDLLALEKEQIQLKNLIIEKNAEEIKILNEKIEELTKKDSNNSKFVKNTKK